MFTGLASGSHVFQVRDSTAVVCVCAGHHGQRGSWSSMFSVGVDVVRWFGRDFVCLDMAFVFVDLSGDGRRSSSGRTMRSAGRHGPRRCTCVTVCCMGGPMDGHRRRLLSVDAHPCMAYREIAIALLERRDSTFIELEVMMVAEAAQALVTPRTRLFEALAEKVLEKLATHRPAAWVDNPWPSRSPVTAHSAAAEVQTGETNYKLEDAFKLWCKKKRLKPTDVNKTKAE